LKDGTDVPLIVEMVDEEAAKYAVQEIETFLGFRDRSGSGG
jgi:hypothetical protein